MWIHREGPRSCLALQRRYLSTEEIWSLGRTIPELKAVFVESSVPDEMGKLAKKSKHLTPALFLKEFQKLGRPDLPLYAYHMKPDFVTRLKSKSADLALSGCCS